MLAHPPVLLGLLGVVLGYAGAFAICAYTAPILTQLTGFVEAAGSPI